MQIYLVYDGNSIIRSYVSENDAIEYASDRYSVINTELYTSFSRQKEKGVGSVHDLMGLGEGLTCILYGAGTSAENFIRPKGIDVVLAANARWSIPNLDFNLYTDLRYSQWLSSGIISLPDSVQHIAMESLTPSDYWFSFKREICGHSGKTLLYVADKIMRFKRIYLIGYDYCLSKQGELHAFEPNGICNQSDKDEHKARIFDCMIQQYDSINWSDDKIINLNPDSALKRFQFA